MQKDDIIEDLTVFRLKENGGEYIKDLVVKEEEFNIYLNSEFMQNILSSPYQIKELIVGRLNFYDIKKSDILDIKIENKNIFIKTNKRGGKTPIRIDKEGDCIGYSLPKVNIFVKPKIFISQKKLNLLIKEFKLLCETYKKTGGIHAAGLADTNRIKFFAEDISRHNAVDKVIGEALLNDESELNILFTTGRATATLVARAEKYKIEIIVALSAPTYAAINLAKICGITLIAFAKFHNRFNIYSHPERIKSEFIPKNMDLFEKIDYLRKKYDAIIVAHNYQDEEIQKIADFVADSLELAKFAANHPAKVVILCGVRFMAESIKLLAGHKRVLLAAKEARCPLADMINVEELKNLKAQHPNATVVCYINSTVEIKAEADICCTSRNVLKVINSIPKDKEIIFIPDKYLASWTEKQTGRKFIVWDGFCPVHMKIVKEDILEKKSMYPQAALLAHPECKPEVLNLADIVCGTGGMLEYAKNSPKEEFIIATERNMCVRLSLELPKKRFYPAAEDAICPNMRFTTLHQLFFSLKEMEYEIKIDESIIESAKKSIERMFLI